MSSRRVSKTRETKETKVSVELDLDGRGECRIETGIGFLDHMIASFGFHAGFDLCLETRGDLDVDCHHTAEDSALTLGAAMDEAVGERRGIERFGQAYAPLDEALARAVVDFSGRPFASVDLALVRPMIGTLACENLVHFVESLAVSSRSAIHLDVLKGRNDHHRAEAAFKALALATKGALRRTSDRTLRSTKGSLS